MPFFTNCTIDTLYLDYFFWNDLDSAQFFVSNKSSKLTDETALVLTDMSCPMDLTILPKRSKNFIDYLCKTNSKFITSNTWAESVC